MDCATVYDVKAYPGCWKVYVMYPPFRGTYVSELYVSDEYKRRVISVPRSKKDIPVPLKIVRGFDLPAKLDDE